MNDRELLELAAEAAGIELSDWSSSENGFIRYHFVTRHIWNPLTNDGDALRLAVKLHLIVGAYETYTSVFQTSAPTPSKEIVCWYGKDNLDPYAATRRAIVRAAAQIGRRTE
jgi:hypothetical protein